MHAEGGSIRVAVLGVAMSTMQFACDPLQNSTLDRAAAWLETEAPSVCWLLVDAAVVDSAWLASVAADAGTACVNSLARSPLVVFGDQAPQLLAIRRATQALEVVRRLAFPDRTAPAFSLFKSEVSVSQLQDLFGYLALPLVEGGLELHCRFADTRVLPSLLRTLSPAQAARVAVSIDEWSWFSRTNDVDRWSAKDRRRAGVYTPDANARIALTNEQFASMLDASEADTIFSTLLDKTPEIVAKKHRGEFHARLQQHLDVATDRSVVQPADRLQFVVLGLTCGADFHRHPDLLPTWRSIQESTASLVELMKTWSDKLWGELQANTKPAG